jgi:hypothetical protein
MGSRRALPETNHHYTNLWPSSSTRTHHLDTFKSFAEVTFDKVFHNERFDLALLHYITPNGQCEGLLCLGLGPEGAADVPAVGEVDERGVDRDEAVQAGDQDGRHRSEGCRGIR